MFIAYLMVRFSVPDENSKGLFHKLKAIAKARIYKEKTVEQHVEEIEEELEPFSEISQRIFSQFVKYSKKTNLEPDFRMSGTLNFLEEDVLLSSAAESLKNNSSVADSLKIQSSAADSLKIQDNSFAYD